MTSKFTELCISAETEKRTSFSSLFHIIPEKEEKKHKTQKLEDAVFALLYLFQFKPNGNFIFKKTDLVIEQGRIGVSMQKPA